MGIRSQALKHEGDVSGEPYEDLIETIKDASVIVDQALPNPDNPFRETAFKMVLRELLDYVHE